MSEPPVKYESDIMTIRRLKAELSRAEYIRKQQVKLIRELQKVFEEEKENRKLISMVADEIRADIKSGKREKIKL